MMQNVSDGMHIGIVKGASHSTPQMQGVISYTLSVNTPNGPVDIAPVYSCQKRWPDGTEVVRWRNGTALVVGVVASRFMGVFDEPANIGDCP